MFIYREKYSENNVNVVVTRKINPNEIFRNYLFLISSIIKNKIWSSQSIQNPEQGLTSFP